MDTYSAGTLEQAKQLLRNAVLYYDEAEQRDGDAYMRSQGDKSMQDAAVYAAVAQAEALTRIADYIEGYAALYLDPAIVSVANRKGV